MVGCWVTSSLSLLYQNHIVSLSLRPTIYICALFLSSFPHFLERKFLVKLIYCDPWMYIRTVVSTTIMWRQSPHFICTCRDLPSPKSIIGRIIGLFGSFKGCYHFNHHLRELRMSTPVGSPPGSRSVCVWLYISYTDFSMNLALMWPVCEVGWGPPKPWDDSFHDCFQW